MRHSRAMGITTGGSSAPTATGTALAIGCFASICRDRLADRLIAFGHRWPAVDIGVHEMPRQELLAGVREQSLALAVTPGEAPADLPAAALWTDQVALAVAASHPLAARGEAGARDLAAEHLLISRQEHGGEMHRFLSNRVAPLAPLPGELCNMGLPRLLTKVAAGEGVALLCMSHAAIAGSGVRLLPFATANATFAVRAVWRDREPGWPLDALIAQLRP